MYYSSEKQVNGIDGFHEKLTPPILCKMASKTHFFSEIISEVHPSKQEELSKIRIVSVFS